MRCYYEVLDVPLKSDAETIKKAYYKQSLLYHPDKNPGNEDKVMAIYQNIQEAYRVLSDPQERAWYDRYRDRILQGGLGQGASSDYQEKKINVFEYFTTACFKSFDDTNDGFYHVYGQLFERLKEEELLIVSDPTLIDLPSFGQSDSDYEEVVSIFYSHWEVFCSQKSYVWMEKYDIPQGTSRRERRLIDAENRKLRDAARKERNQEVRALVAFVKKRDPRVALQRKLLSEAGEAKRLRSLELAQEAKARDQRNLAQQLAAFQLQNEEADKLLEAQLRELEAHWNEEDNSEEESFHEDVEDHVDLQTSASEGLEIYRDLNRYNCPACKKSFKTAASFDNHLDSKKHKKEVENLRKQLIKEDPEIDEDKLNDLLDFRVVNSDGLDSVSQSEDDDLLTNQTENSISLADEDNDCVKTEVECSESTSQNPANHQKSRKKKKTGDVATGSENPTTCSICSAKFHTRNQLFTHIRESGHARLKTEVPLASSSSRSKKTKSKK